MENIIIVERPVFFVNTLNPKEVAYEQPKGKHWKLMIVQTYVEPPQPTESQIFYQLKGWTTRGTLID